MYVEPKVFALRVKKVPGFVSDFLRQVEIVNLDIVGIAGASVPAAHGVVAEMVFEKVNHFLSVVMIYCFGKHVIYPFYDDFVFEVISDIRDSCFVLSV